MEIQITNNSEVSQTNFHLEAYNEYSSSKRLTLTVKLWPDIVINGPVDDSIIIQAFRRPEKINDFSAPLLVIIIFTITIFVIILSITGIIAKKYCRADKQPYGEKFGNYDSTLNTPKEEQLKSCSEFSGDRTISTPLSATKKLTNRRDICNSTN